MKKISLIMIIAVMTIVFLAGCSSERTMTCTRTNQDDSVIIEEESVVTSTSDGISATTKTTFNSEEEAKSYASSITDDDVELTVNGKVVTEVEKTSIPADLSSSLEDLKVEYENDGWTCKIS